MKLRANRWIGGALALAVAAFAAQEAAAQTTMPSTLRHGSGYLDNPAASVLPHLAIQGTFSGFFSNLSQTVLTDANGNAIGYGGGSDNFYKDASVSVGLFDRAEVGASLLSLNDANAGGNLFGAYGRVAILKPAAQGFGLAVGARYNNAPDFGDNITYAPNRLGYPDARVRETYSGSDVDTQLSLYGVGTLFLRGFESTWFPKNDVTVSLGYGTGLFQEGDQFGWYSYADSDGWFAGANMAIEVAEETALNLIGEYNGFDINLGAQVDYKGVRVGAHLLGSNYADDLTTYRSSKLGILASVGVCGNGLCKPMFLDRPEPEVIQLPAPAPDTIIVTREVAPAAPTGNPANICLATGQDVSVLMTAQGDTLVGPNRVSIRTLRPGVVFAGTYADGRAWYTNDEDISFEEQAYSKSGNPVSQQCANLMRIGEHMGVPLFVTRSAERPFATIFVPVRPGVWQAYQSLRGTRGF